MDDDDGPEVNDDDADASGTLDCMSNPVIVSARIGTFSTTLSAYIFAASGQWNVLS